MGRRCLNFERCVIDVIQCHGAPGPIIIFHCLFYYLRVSAGNRTRCQTRFNLCWREKLDEGLKGISKLLSSETPHLLSLCNYQACVSPREWCQTLASHSALSCWSHHRPFHLSDCSLECIVDELTVPTVQSAKRNFVHKQNNIHYWILTQ